MIVVIQCAARKRPSAGYWRTAEGKRVLFVADPSAAPAIDGVAWARPDDISDMGKTWRNEVLAYNGDPGENPLGLLPAFELYENEVYRVLAAKVGLSNLFILSAGWGLLPATFLTPCYDITFSAQADPYRRRRISDRYQDFSIHFSSKSEAILFFGGRDYLQLLDQLTENAEGQRIIFFNSMHEPKLGRGRAVRFVTSTRTNWHYECAQAFLKGNLEHVLT